MRSVCLPVRKMESELKPEVTRAQRRTETPSSVSTTPEQSSLINNPVVMVVFGNKSSRAGSFVWQSEYENVYEGVNYT